MDVNEQQKTTELESRLSASLAANRELERSNAFGAALIENLPFAVMVTDPDFRIATTNQLFSAIFPPPAEGGTGMDASVFFQAHRANIVNSSEFFELLLQARVEYLDTFEIEMVLSGENQPRYLCRMFPVLEREEACLGRMFLFTDYSRHHMEVEALAEKTRELESFVYTISHDLKNPISVIMGVSDLMAEQFIPFLDADGREFLRMVKEEAEKMLKMVDDILQVSRVQRGVVSKEDVDTQQLLDEIVAEFQHIYRDVAVIFILQDSLPTVQAQPTMMTRIFKNLLSNAIKYSDSSKPRTIIEVGCSRHRGRYQFFVRDNGMGMSAEESAQVFDMFYRVEEGTIEGSGLGTYIVKKLVEAHGGKVWLESAKGQGTTFTFTIPRQETEEEIPSDFE